MLSKAYRLVGEYVCVRAVFEYVSRGLSLWTDSLVRQNFKLQRCIPSIFVACSLVCVFSD